ncbi:hypothetical protein K505DRAFT_9936 [Melanomma pulvis-pyrius CBS 109.77]|uniref:Transcription factor domain-containing protein n=1 Tax=Melanomma pulvis-pyrius CBS 109.77 TaxID=1314802 RepID=A0A6A6XHL1_9PLEO|nr:hypothetical protein K505DRAFT_9936 [Melanomma pulvis-pyrius CBS 109.77]
MEQFQFVTVSHPDQIKDKGKQNTIRRHAIRSSLKKNRDDAEKRRENFVEVEVSAKGHGLIKKRTGMEKESVGTSPSAARVDPFDTLPGSPDPLRVLVGHKSVRQVGEPVFCVGDAGLVFFQGMETVSRGAFTDPALFHALSLILSLAANNNIPNLECLKYRGETLKSLTERMADLKMVPAVSTLTAILLLIGYEYRVDGTTSKSIALHIRAVDEVIRMNREANIELSDAIRRALFWQDLYSCFFVSTTRLLSHENYPEFCWARDPDRIYSYVVPLGFRSISRTLPPDFQVLLEDLNALCSLVDFNCGPGGTPINKLPIDNGQAWIESRLVNLLYDSRKSREESNLYEACIFALFLCTYKLYTGIWEGCFIPEFCASQVLGLVSRATSISPAKHSPEIVLWLLFVSGALAERSRTKLRASVLILSLYRERVEQLHQDWKQFKETLKSFIWSEYTMEQKFLRFWEELHPGQES